MYGKMRRFLLTLINLRPWRIRHDCATGQGSRSRRRSGAEMIRRTSAQLSAPINKLLRQPVGVNSTESAARAAARTQQWCLKFSLRRRDWLMQRWSSNYGRSRAGRGAVEDDGAVAPTTAESACNCVAEWHLLLSCWAVSSSERRRCRWDGRLASRANWLPTN